MQDNEGHTAYISVGSNIGDRWGHLKYAVQALQALTSAKVRCSGVYETAPVGYTAQPDFLNLVLRMDTTLSPLALLAELQAIEAARGRKRDIRFGPRTLDLDLLLYDDIYLCYRTLQIPHPRMWERAFVLVPLAELAPQMRAPGRRTVASLAQSLAEVGGIQYVGRIWQATSGLSEAETLDAGGFGTRDRR
ncbi:MAG: 2-amino-4-hydroxy-6-hydroxymethyldihydropteridine diphosphokinase [Alicyclobacillus sp.]|nr:2-amino-4-hydroxy-6-hydroxymethyldihydropteridine diphosphokinase [Alicyclobacillus sp.]